METDRVSIMLFASIGLYPFKFGEGTTQKTQKRYGPFIYSVGQWGGHMKLEPTREFYVPNRYFSGQPE